MGVERDDRGGLRRFDDLEAFEQLLFEWIHVGSGPGSLSVDFALWLDPLSMVMVLIITNVGALIHL